jgi:acylphosphatase
MNPDPILVSGRSAAEIVVEGRVQGVGYRYFAQRRAQSLGLAGYVSNLKDGRVRAHAEGPRAIIEDFVRALEKGPPLSHVDTVTVRWVPPTGRFDDFGVRFAEFEP